MKHRNQMNKRVGDGETQKNGKKIRFYEYILFLNLQNCSLLDSCKKQKKVFIAGNIAMNRKF